MTGVKNHKELLEKAEELKKILEEMNTTNVKIALFGQPGAGKSSIVNALLGSDQVETGVETDKTQKASGHVWKNGLEIHDLPGYGTAKFRKETFLKDFDVLSYDLFLCVVSGKLHDSDVDLFRELQQNNKVCIFVSSKSDMLWQPGVEENELRQRRIGDLRKFVGDAPKIIHTSIKTGDGLEELQMEIHRHLEPAKAERWARSAKAHSTEFLKEKRTACQKYIEVTAGLSAVTTAFTPIGVDVAVDVGLLHLLFNEIRNSYGLDDSFKKKAKQSSWKEKAAKMLQTIFIQSEKDILKFIAKYAGKQAAKTATKIIPLAGQLISSSLAAWITYSAGDEFLNECHNFTNSVLDESLRKSEAA